MIKVLLSIGSNYGEREQNVSLAAKNLSKILFFFKESPVYETEGAGLKSGMTRYYNCVVEGYFPRTLEELETLLKRMEKEAGRDATRRERGEVPLDIDIVVADSVILKEWDFKQQFFQYGYSFIQNALNPVESKTD